MDSPKVSIIIRTCGRPQILKKALNSICQQTYKNIEVIVIEDGSNVSETFIKENYKSLSIVYVSTGEKKGRCFAGNLGLMHVTGSYINFLDDDDLLLPFHIETLVNKIIENNSQAAYAIAEEHQIIENKHNPENYTIKRRFIRYKQPYNRLLLYYMNYIPIQSIMFSKSLYETFGGFDEELEVLEDWDLWVRYSTKYNFAYVPIITSIYFTPYKRNDKKERDIRLKIGNDKIIQKFNLYSANLTVCQINQDMDYILNIFNRKKVLFYLQKIRNFILYRDR